MADKMMELQPDKTRVFLDFVGSASDREKNNNAFIKYMRQVMGMRDIAAPISKVDNLSNYIDDDEY